jgi:diguanylate cyclase (GGDEF)-like protein
MSKKNPHKRSIRLIIAEKLLAPLDTTSIVIFYTVAFGVIHLALLVLALSVRAYSLAVYQIIPIAWYTFLYFIKTKAFTQKIYYLTVAEMIVNAVLCTVIIGSTYDFFLYLLIVPANSYFLSYHMRENNFGKMRPFPPTIVSAVFAIGLSLLDIPAATDLIIVHVVSAINVFIFFSAIVFIMLAFYTSIYAVEKELDIKNKQLIRAANTDFLTGALNRREFTHLFDTMKDKVPFCIVMGDIDSFKAVNDTYGHDVGDNVIITAVNIMQSHLKPDDLIARWGGEEFLILLKNTELSDAKGLMKQIEQDIRTVKVKNQEDYIKFTMTFGITACDNDSPYPTTKNLLEVLTKETDRKLYFGKTHGKNTIITELPEEDAAEVVTLSLNYSYD